MRRAEDLKAGDKVALWTGVGFSHYTVAKVGPKPRWLGIAPERPTCFWLTRQWAGRTSKPIMFTAAALQNKLDEAVRRQTERV